MMQKVWLILCFMPVMVQVMWASDPCLPPDGCETVDFAHANGPELPEGCILGYETILDNGPVTNRVDIVYVGDGFTLAEIQDYRDKVTSVFDNFFELGKSEPLKTYKSYFNVHRVDVVSEQTGISTPGNTVDTPLGMIITTDN